MVENRGPELQAVCSTFVSMAFVATALRIYVRAKVVKAFGWDDAWMTFAMLTHIMFATCAIGGVHYGTGRHMADLTPEGIFKAMRYWWLCYIAYCWTMIAAKISIGLFLLRVTVDRLQRWIIFTVMGLTVLTGFVFFFVTLLQCTPISFFWDRSQPGSCINVYVIIGLTYLYSAISAICDFTFGLLPIWLVWNLNMSKSSKMALIPILSMACIASTAVIVRMAYVLDFKNPDFLYATIDIAIWSDTEQGLAITAGSLATLRPLYRAVAARLGWSQMSTHPLKESGGRPYNDRSGMSGSKPKRSGPFSLVTLTRNDGKDEEYGLGNARPMQLRDDLIDESGRSESDKGYASWRIQVGDNSEEDLNRKPSLGGIKRQTDVYQSSEYENRRKA